jgi:Terminase DNA packaging enzyme
MSQFDKRLNKIFDIAPVEQESTELQEFIPASTTENNDLSSLLSHDLNQDYEIVRDNISNVIQKQMEAVDDMLSIARQTEKARDFEVAGNLMKQLVENSKELLDIQKQMRDLTGQKESSATTNIKNAVFVGSTTELLKAMKDLKMKED